MAVFSQELTRANNDIHAINTSLNRDLDIVHVTPDVGQNLSLQTELADGLAVESALLTGARAGKLDTVDTERVERLGDLDLGLGVKVGIGKLLALS